MYRLNDLIEKDLTEFLLLMNTAISSSDLIPIILNDDISIPVEYVALVLCDNLRFTENCPKYSIFEQLENCEEVLDPIVLKKYIEVSKLGQEIMDTFKGSSILSRAVTVIFVYKFAEERKEG